jgi:hypothetical protein
MLLVFAGKDNKKLRKTNILLTQFSYLAINCLVIWSIINWLFDPLPLGDLDFIATPALALFCTDR